MKLSEQLNPIYFSTYEDPRGCDILDPGAAGLFTASVHTLAGVSNGSNAFQHLLLETTSKEGPSNGKAEAFATMQISANSRPVLKAKRT